MDLLGILYEIDPVETRNFNGADGQPREYRFCEVVIDCSGYNKMTGERYENLVHVVFSSTSLRTSPPALVSKSCVIPKAGASPRPTEAKPAATSKSAPSALSLSPILRGHRARPRRRSRPHSDKRHRPRRRHRNPPQIPTISRSNNSSE